MQTKDKTEAQQKFVQDQKQAKAAQALLSKAAAMLADAGYAELCLKVQLVEQMCEECI